MTEKSRDLADVKTGNISLQPIKDIPEEIQTRPVPVRTMFEPPPELPPEEFQNGTFLPGSLTNDLLSSQGITSARPEIIAHTVFEPVWSQGVTEEPTSLMLKTQWAARKIREENLKKFVDYLKNDSETKTIIEQLSNLFNESIEEASQDVEKIKNIWVKFDGFMYALDLYTTKDDVQKRASNVEDQTDKLYTLDEIFSKLGFNPVNVQYWTNTKTVGQLLLDLSYTARKYSLELFSDYKTGPIKTAKNSRIIDNNPFDYSIPNYSAIPNWEVYSGKNSLSSIEKYLTDESLSGTNGFADQSLLTNVGAGGLQRLRVLAITLSRILGLSRVYTDTEFFQQYLNVFDISLGSVKNFIKPAIGDTTKSIVDPVISGQNDTGQTITSNKTTLHSLQIINGGNKTLPLERRDVSSNPNSNTVTGGSGYDYFFTGLTSTSAGAGDKLNTVRIRQFKDAISSRIRLATRMIEVGCLTDTYFSREKNNQATLDLLRADKMLLEFRKLYEMFTNTDAPRIANFRAACYYATISSQARAILIRYTAAILIKFGKGRSTFIDSFTVDQKWNTIIGPNFIIPSILIPFNLSDENIAPYVDSYLLQFRPLDIQFEDISRIIDDDMHQVIYSLVGKKPKKALNQGWEGLPHGGEHAELWSAFVNLIQRIEDAAGNHTDADGNTWHMRVSSRTRFMFYIDMFITMLGYDKINYFIPLQYHAEITDIDQTKVDNFLSNSDNNPFIGIAVNGCTEDRRMIQSMTSLLRAYVGRISEFYKGQYQDISTSQDVLGGITQFGGAPTGAGGAPPATQQKNTSLLNDANARRILVSKQQTALSILELDDVKWSVERGSIFSDDSGISYLMMRLMLDKLFKTDKYRDKNLMRVLTLGLCPGTNSIIEGQDKTTRTDVPRKNWRQSDFVTVKVYVKNLLEEDIVFKPIEFTFELSRFVNMRSFEGLTDEIVASKAYDALVYNHTNFIDMSVSVNDLKRFTCVESQNFERYKNTITPSLFRKTCINHVTSYLLGLYIKLLSGVSTQEKSFLLEPDITQYSSAETTAQLYRQLLEILIAKNSPTITLQQFLERYPAFAQKLQSIQQGQFGTGLFEDATIIDPQVFDATDILIAEDLLDISKLMTVKSSITAGEKVARRITSPKLFERIFNIPVYLPDFEIDTKLTKSTFSGNSAYTRLNKAGMLTFKQNSQKVYYKWNQESMQTVQMWMTISTLDVGGLGIKKVSFIDPNQQNPIKNQLGSAILEPTIPPPVLPLQPPKNKLNQLPPPLPPPQPSQPIKNNFNQLPPPTQPPPSPKPPPPSKKTLFNKF